MGNEMKGEGENMSKCIKIMEPNKTAVQEDEISTNDFAKLTTAGAVWDFLDSNLPLVEEWKAQAAERMVARDPGFLTVLWHLAILHAGKKRLECRLLKYGTLTDDEFKRLREYNKLIVDYLKQAQSFSRSQQISIKDRATSMQNKGIVQDITEQLNNNSHAGDNEKQVNAARPKGW